MTFGSHRRSSPRHWPCTVPQHPPAGTAGVFLGGVLTEYASWPWVFFINVPIAAVVLALTRSVMPAGVTRRGSLDVAGAVTATPASLRSSSRWSARLRPAGPLLDADPGSVGWRCYACSSPRPGCVCRWCDSASSPPNLAAANAAQFLLGAAWIPMFFFLNLYLQQVLGSR